MQFVFLHRVWVILWICWFWCFFNKKDFGPLLVKWLHVSGTKWTFMIWSFFVYRISMLFSCTEWHLSYLTCSFFCLNIHVWHRFHLKKAFLLLHISTCINFKWTYFFAYYKKKIHYIFFTCHLFHGNRIWNFLIWDSFKCFTHEINVENNFQLA